MALKSLIKQNHNKTRQRICTMFLIQFKQKKSCSKHGESELEQKNQCPENREKAHQNAAAVKPVTKETPTKAQGKLLWFGKILGGGVFVSF